MNASKNVNGLVFITRLYPTLTPPCLFPSTGIKCPHSFLDNQMMSEADNNSETLPEKKEFSNAQPIKFFLALYALTGGFYFFYWFYKNLTNFKDPKVLNQTS